MLFRSALTADETHGNGGPDAHEGSGYDLPEAPEWDEQTHGVTQPRVRGTVA